MKSASLDYLDIIKRAFDLVIKNKFLWLLGFLTGGSAFGNSSRFFTLPFDPDNFNPEPNRTNVALANVQSAGKVLGEAIGPSAVGGWGIWIFAAVGIFIIFGLLVYLVVTARGAIIFAVDELDDGKDANLSKSWLLGQKFFWRRLSFGIIVFLILFLPLVILATPVVILGIYELVIPAVILGIIFLLAYVLYAIYLSLIIPYAERLLFLQKVTPSKALPAGLKFFNKNWKELVIVLLINMAIASVVGFAALIFLFLLMGQFIAGGMLLMISQTWGMILIILMGVIMMVAMAFFNGIVSAYFSSIYTLVFKRV